MEDPQQTLLRRFVADEEQVQRSRDAAGDFEEEE